MIDYKTLYAPEGLKNHWKEEQTNLVYHADKNFVNSSSLKKMVKSPFAFHNAFYGTSEQPTESMKFGTLAHLALLQGSKFREKYIVMPEFESRTADGRLSESKATKYYKEQMAEWKSTMPTDAILVTAEERDRLFSMVDSLLSHNMAMNLLKDGKPEIAGYWKDPETGVACRMQADFISFNLNALIDVKTTQDCEWELFRKSVEGFHYSFQMAMYAEGIKQITGKKPDHIAWIAIESKAPFEVRVYEMSPQYEAIGNHDFRFALRKLKECIDRGSFEQGQKEIEMAEPSVWFFKKYEEKNFFNNI